MEAQIDILLSTYNGERYLAEQIESIIHQSYTDWHLLIRDDGSTDKTTDIIAHYVTLYPQQIEILPGGTNIGIIRSFEELLRTSKAKYCMLSDQDDVWKEDKIEVSIRHLQQIEQQYPNEGVLCYSDLELVDEQLRPMHTTFWQYNRLKMPLANEWKWTCISNPMPGCSCIMNEKAKAMVVPFPEGIPMHDWWIITKVGKEGKTDYIPQATMLYRQHGNNAYGVKRPDWRYYAKIALLPTHKLKEFRKLRPFLSLIGFGGIVKYALYKTIYAVLRRI
ncbi:MAG: glycosyltransferase family 2 protein [Paludibacteraceae bacterium]|nr:glycosyltransferase family 2 protein [Paludibacteraceae bacterium]